MVGKKVVDVTGAAEYLAVSKNTVYRMAESGIIGGKVGKLWRFRIEDLDRYLSDGVVSNAMYRGASNEQVEARNA